jgi:hypothetical protein
MDKSTIFRLLDPSTALGALLLSVVAGLLVIGLQRVYTKTQLILSNYKLLSLSKSYTLSGYWFSYELKDESIWLINYNKVIQRKNKISFRVWQYSTTTIFEGCKWYYSEGIMKGNHLAAYYYSGDINFPETGAFICKQEGKKLVAGYLQYSVDHETAELLTSPEYYSLQRIKMPYKSRLRMFFSKPPFISKKEAFEFINQPENAIKWNRVA